MDPEKEPLLMRFFLSLTVSLTVAATSLPHAFAMDGEPPLERTALTAALDTSPRVQAARAEADVIEQQHRQLEAEGGWRAFGALSGAAVNEIEGNNGNRRYDRLQGDIGVSRPLLGSLTAQRKALLTLERQRVRAEGRTGEITETVGREVREAYAKYWISDRRYRLASAWHQRLSDRLEGLRPQVGTTLRASEFAEARSALRLARENRRRARNDRQMQLHALEALLGESIRPFDPRWPVERGICGRAGVLLEAALAADPISESARRELALLLERGNSGLADEVQSDLVLTHTQTVEDWDENGDETSIGLTAEIPLSLGQARDARRNLRNAEVLQVQRRIEANRQELRGRIGVAMAELRNTTQARQAANARLDQARDDWNEERRRLRSGLTRSPMPALRAAIRWYQTADERLDREAEWLVARAPLETIETPGCSAPRPEIMESAREEIPTS
ncbi:TolC family protein [Spiribacter sp. 221]